MMPVKIPLRNLLHHVVALALPPTCIACRTLLPATEPLVVCTTCWQTLPFWKKETEPMPDLPPHVDSFHAPFLYEKPVNHWVSNAKFADRTELLTVLAEFMQAHLPKEENLLLVPVPIHTSRLRQRLYNQSAILAANIAQKTGNPWCHKALKRVQKTEPQVSKTRRQRIQLSSKVFQANPKHVQGKHIVLIDDIWTTGSTARACAEALKKAGAARVNVITTAYVAP